MSIFKNISKAMTPSFLTTTSKLVDGVLTVAARAVDEWEANSAEDAVLRKQEHKLIQEQRKLDIKLDTVEFKVHADKAILDAKLIEAKHTVARMEQEFNVMVHTSAVMMVQHPDKADLLKTKLVEHKANMEAAKALVLELASISIEPEEDSFTSFDSAFDVNDL